MRLAFYSEDGPRPGSKLKNVKKKHNAERDNELEYKMDDCGCAGGGETYIYTAALTNLTEQPLVGEELRQCEFIYTETKV